MKTMPMIFNSEMVNALLSGEKTVTRRPMKIPANWQLRDRNLSKITASHPKKGKWGALIQNLTDAKFPQADLVAAPAYIDDLIYVRETWANAGANAPELTLYKANYPEHVPAHYENVPNLSKIKWTPSIHMPRWASRLTLKVTDIRIEQVQDITEEQAINEGMQPARPSSLVMPYRTSFMDIWDNIYGSWTDNPYVWVIEFEVINQNIDSFLNKKTA